MLKIYLYGYQNGIRSSRRLEKECKRNTEMQWLCGNWFPTTTPLLTSVKTIRSL
ncbi:MAG: transposase [Bacteroidetes bacterium]|nr:transposase [Bacteroidota bacterium]